MFGGPDWPRLEKRAPSLYASYATDQSNRSSARSRAADPSIGDPGIGLEDVRASVARLESMATLMDSAVRIPGTSVVMGLDALLGLLPVVGDAISSAIGGYLIWEARRLGASRLLIARMAANTTIDTLVGSVPILGDVFDVAFRANRKNVALLKAHLEKHGANLSTDGKTIETSYRVEPF